MQPPSWFTLSHAHTIYIPLKILGSENGIVFAVDLMS